MKTNILTMSVIGMIALLGLGVQPSLASPEPGPYGEMREHQPQHANHLRHLLKHQKELGLTEEQVKKLKKPLNSNSIVHESDSKRRFV